MLVEQPGRNNRRLSRLLSGHCRENGNSFYDSNYDSLQSELEASDSGYSCGPSPMQSARGKASRIRKYVRVHEEKTA